MKRAKAPTSQVQRILNAAACLAALFSVFLLPGLIMLCFTAMLA